MFRGHVVLGHPRRTKVDRFWAALLTASIGYFVLNGGSCVLSKLDTLATLSTHVLSGV